MAKPSALLLMCLLSGCVSARPAVLRDMTSLPDDADKQHAQMESVTARPSADSRKPLSKRARQVETAAATVVAFVGMLYSTSSNVLLGTGGEIEEMLLVDPHYGKRPKPDAEEEAKPDYDDADKIVPWLRFDSHKR